MIKKFLLKDVVSNRYYVGTVFVTGVVPVVMKHTTNPREAAQFGSYQEAEKVAAEWFSNYPEATELFAVEGVFVNGGESDG